MNLTARVASTRAKTYTPTYAVGERFKRAQLKILF
jgi:hypothetical protein